MVKQRMTTLDVRASIEEIRSKVIGLRLLNLYDLNPKMFVFRFGHGENKKAVLLENGVRFHLTEFTREKPQVPSQFTLKLRKHIRSWRLDSISQLENDRTIDLCFGPAGTELCFHIIIELFSKGNIILTDHSYTILMLLRTHQDEDVKIAVRQTYPAGLERKSNGIALHEWHVSDVSGKLEMRQRSVVSSSCVGKEAAPNDISEELAAQETERRSKSLREAWITIYGRNSDDETFKSTLSGVHHFGPGLAEHILTLAKLPPNKKKKDNKEYTAEEIFDILEPHMLRAWDITDVKLPPGGYLLKLTSRGGEKGRNKKKAQKPGIEEPKDSNEKSVSNDGNFHKDPNTLEEPCCPNDTTECMHSSPPSSTKPLLNSPQKDFPEGEKGAKNETLPISDVASFQTSVASNAIQYDDFSPVLLAQFESATTVMDAVYLSSFGEVCDRFFLPTEAEKIELHNDKKKNTALNKLEKFERDHLRRMDGLKQQQEVNAKLGEVLIAHADEVDEAIALINGALATGLQWNALRTLIKQRQQEGHPIAYIIHDLFFERNAISVLLEDDLSVEDNANEIPSLVVEVSLSKSAHANAAVYFAKKKFSAQKLQKTIAAKGKAEAGAARKGERQAAAQKAKKQLKVERKRGWWEKFNFFFTSTGDVVLQGKDQQTTELLVRRIMQLGDLFVHCDVPGALPCLLRPSKLILGSAAAETVSSESNHATDTYLVQSASLIEVGGWCVSRSAAWQRKQTTSAWWIYGSQISGGSVTGSYLFEGERHFIPPQPLSLGFGLVFAVDKSSSREKHLSESVKEDESEKTIQACFQAISDSEVIRDYQGRSRSFIMEEKMEDPATSLGSIADGVPPDPAAALHQIATVEELRAEQRKNISIFTGSTQKSTAGFKGKGEERKGHPASTAHEKGNPKKDYPSVSNSLIVSKAAIEVKQQEVMQGNLTKQQSRKLKKIRKKFGDQDPEDRQMAAKLNGNTGSLVEALLNEKKTITGTKKTGKIIPHETKCQTTVQPHSVQVDHEVLHRDSEEVEVTPVAVNDINEKAHSTVAEQETEEDITDQQSSLLSNDVESDLTKESLPVLLTPQLSREEAAAKMTQELASALSLYTCFPRPEQRILYILGVCAPFSTTLHKYPFKVELVPGVVKKGQVAGDILAHFHQTLQKMEKNSNNSSSASQWIAAHKDNLHSQLQQAEPLEIIEQLRSDAKVH